MTPILIIQCYGNAKTNHFLFKNFQLINKMKIFVFYLLTVEAIFDKERFKIFHFSSGYYS